MSEQKTKYSSAENSLGVVTPDGVNVVKNQLKQADDYDIATGESNSLQDFVDIVFISFGLNWQNYVVKNSDLFRATDIAVGKGNSTKAKVILN